METLIFYILFVLGVTLGIPIANNSKWVIIVLAQSEVYERQAFHVADRSSGVNKQSRAFDNNAVLKCRVFEQGSDEGARMGKILAYRAISVTFENQPKALEGEDQRSGRFRWLIVLISVLLLGMAGYGLFRLKERLIALHENILQKKKLIDALGQQKSKMIGQYDGYRDLDNEHSLKKRSAYHRYDEWFARVKEYSSTLNSDERWLISKVLPKEGSVGFDKVFQMFEMAYIPDDPTFLDRLSRRFPNLTNNERRLCVYFRKGLTNAEVTMITKRSASTLLTSKSRLRAALRISDQEISVEDFLRSI